VIYKAGSAAKQHNADKRQMLVVCSVPVPELMFVFPVLWILVMHGSSVSLELCSSFLEAKLLMYFDVV